MEGFNEIKNRVKNSGLIEINPADLIPSGERVLIDIAPKLHMGLVLKEKDFRNYIIQENWEVFKNKHVAITCSNDAIVPVWAFMLIAVQLEPFAQTVVLGQLMDLEKVLIDRAVNQLDVSPFEGSKVVIKGCGDKKTDQHLFVALSTRLRPIVKSIFFGEPCSTVPIIKNKTL